MTFQKLVSDKIGDLEDALASAKKSYFDPVVGGLNELRRKRGMSYTDQNFRQDVQSQAANSLAFALGAQQGYGFNLADEGTGLAFAPIAKTYDMIMRRPSKSLSDYYNQTVQTRRFADKAFRSYAPASYTAGESAGAAMNSLRVGGFNRQLLRAASDGGVVASLQGFGAGEGWEDSLAKARQNGLTGAVTGFGVDILSPYVAKLGQKAVTPFGVSAERGAQVDVLEKEGIGLTAGQTTGSSFLQEAENALASAKTDTIHAAQRRQFSAATFRHGGIDADGSASARNLIDNALKQSDINFKAASENIPRKVDQTLLRSAYQIGERYRAGVPVANRVLIVEETLNKIRNNAGGMASNDLTSIANNLSDLGNLTDDPILKQTTSEFAKALEQQADRNSQALNPESLAAWRDARQQKLNISVIDSAYRRTGNDTLTRSSVLEALNEMGPGSSIPLSELADAGSELLKQARNNRSLGRIAKSLAPHAASALAGFGMSGPVGAALMLGIPKIAGAILMSKPAQSYLRNTIAQNGISKAATRSISTALTRAATQNLSNSP